MSQTVKSKILAIDALVVAFLAFVIVRRRSKTMKDQNVVETNASLAIARQEVPPTTPAPIVVQMLPKKRDIVERFLVVVQSVTLIAVIIYVVLTGWIAVSGVRTTKAQIAVTLVDQLYSDPTVHDMLDKIYTHNIEFYKKENGDPFLTSAGDSTEQNLEPKLVIMLNRFQILGQLLDLGVLQKHDLIGLRYEIIEVGRDKAVRKYFDFLNNDYQKSSGISHDHFKNFKSLYLAFEYEPSQRDEFKKYLFSYPPGTSPEDE
jgi:hypothetical protein